MVDEYAITCHGPEATTRRGAPDRLEVHDGLLLLAATALAPGCRWPAAPHLRQLHDHRLRRRAHRPAHDRRQHTHLDLRLVLLTMDHDLVSAPAHRRLPLVQRTLAQRFVLAGRRGEARLREQAVDDFDLS